jgi:hypothetical protein
MSLVTHQGPRKAAASVERGECQWRGRLPVACHPERSEGSGGLTTDRGEAAQIPRCARDDGWAASGGLSRRMTAGVRYGRRRSLSAPLQSTTDEVACRNT